MSTPALPLSLPRRRALGWADRAATVVLVAVLVMLALGVGLRLAGIVPLVDHSGSMAPAIGAGDVVLARETTAGALARGQIATLHDPLSGRLITHRVVSVARDGARVTVVTRGDANDASERWVLRADAPVRRVVGRIPIAGELLLRLTSPAARLALAALGAALLAAAFVRRIWSDG